MSVSRSTSFRRSSHTSNSGATPTLRRQPGVGKSNSQRSATATNPAAQTSQPTVQPPLRKFYRGANRVAHHLTMPDNQKPSGIGTDDDDDDLVWQPGQHLPRNPPRQNINYDDESGSNSYIPPSDVFALIVEMKTSIEASIDNKFIGVQSSIEQLSSRLEKLEDRSVSQSSAGENTPVSSSSTNGNVSDEATPKRKRRVPVDVANTVRIIHNNLPCEKKLKVNELIESEHNRQVLKLVTKEVDGKFSMSDIKKSLGQYRKTLMRKPKESELSIESRKKRARKQRKFERRGSKVVGENEQQLWNQLTVSMMSDEEDIDESTFKVCPPEWRSYELNKLLADLDMRANTDPSNKGHPRKTRVQGTPVKHSPPPNAKEWMMISNDVDETDPSMENDIQ